MKKYYLVSNKHTSGYVRTFWKPDGNGYTVNLDEAGLYDLTNKYPLITKENLSTRGKYETYFIAIEDIELIGKKMTCILN